MVLISILTIICLIEGLILLLIDLSSKKKFEILCKDFQDEFNYLPTDVLVYSGGGFMFSFLRDAFFMYALLFKEGGYYTRKMKKEELIFIKSLPRKLTDWLRFKFYLTILSIITFVILVVYSFYYKILP